MAHRLLVNVIFTGAAVFGRAFTEAYKQAAKASAAAQATGATKAKSVGGVPLDEALKILDIDRKELTMEEIDKKYGYLFDVNSKEKGNSFYLQSKVYYAMDALKKELDNLLSPLHPPTDLSPEAPYMSKNRDDEQLLADASTLLMFANAAARQRSPGPPRSPSAPAARQPVLQTAAAVKTETGGLPQPPQSGPRANGQPPYATYNMPAKSPSTAPSRPHLPAYQGPGAQRRPSLQSPPPVGASAANPLPSHLPALNQYPHSNQYLPNNGYLPTLGPPLRTKSRSASPPVISQSQVNSPHTQVNSPHTQVNSPHTQAVNSPHTQAVNSPHTQPVNSPRTQEQRAQRTHQSPGLERPYVPQKLVPLSPKPPVEGSLPAQGSFSHTHRRTVSGGLQAQKSRSPSVTSPQSASAALKRGIDVESGKRSSNNAMIAAAALAAAAEVPFPLKVNDNDKTRAASRSAPPIPTQPPTEPADPPKLQNAVTGSSEPTISVKTEDPAATEAEEDENKTEEEAQTPQMNHAAVPLETKPAATKASKDAKNAPKAKSSKSTKNAKDGSKPDSKEAPSDTPKISPKEESKATPKVVERPADVPALESYKVDPDAGIIGCICEIEEDDGFTIQCDVCFRWQHCSCMGYLNSEEVPEDEYKCYFCDTQKWNRIDAQECKKATIARLELDKVNETPEKPATKRKTSSSGNDEKKRRKSEREVKTADRPSNEKRKSSAMLSPPTPAIPAFDINNKSNPLLDDGVTAEAYSGVYYRLEENDYKTPGVRNKLSEIGNAAEKAEVKSELKCMSLSQLKSLKLSKINLPNHQKYLQDRNELRQGKENNKTSIKVKTYSDNPKHKFVGISKVGLFISESASMSSPEFVIPSGTMVIEYLGEVDTFESYASNKVNQYGLWGTVKPRVAKINLQQAPLEPLNVVLDARFVGNEARFIRKSCAAGANCMLKPVFVPQLQQFKFFVVTTKPITLKGDKNEEELRLAWEWDENHPIREMMQLTPEGNYEEGKKFEDFTEDQKALLMTGIDTILNFVECACNTTSLNSQCSMFKVKRATSYLLRSTRKASSLSNTSLNKFKEDLVVPKSTKDHVPWLQRLKERDNTIHLSLFAIGASGDNSEASDEDMADSDEEDPSLNPEESVKAEISVKLVPRKALLSKGRDFASRHFEVISNQPDEVDLSKAPAEHVSVELGVPLTTELYESIKAKVNEKFKPLAEISSNIKLVSEVKDVQAEPEQEKIAPVVSAPQAAPAVTAEAAPVEKKPAAVKKFSFADYKKKMK